MTTDALPPWLTGPLAQALQATRGHALLLHGPQGIGQFELAMAVASAWLCEAEEGARPSGRACGHCSACHLLAARTHPDLLVLIPEALQDALGWNAADDADDAEGGKGKAKPSKEIKVEAVRAAVAFAQQTASRGGAKLVVVHPADRMNATSANALLKTLEEPPGRARFVLTSSAPQRLLPTVRSRCQAQRVPLPDAGVATSWLAARQVEEAAVLLAAAGGAPLDVIDRLALGVDAACWQRLPREVMAGQSATLAAWPLPLAIEALQKLCHDAMALAVGAAPRYFPVAALPTGADLSRLTDCARELRAEGRRAEHPWNATLAVESLVQSVRYAMQSPVSGRVARDPLATLAR
jgi:DNA polymerase III subunit delta'